MGIADHSCHLPPGTTVFASMSWLNGWMLIAAAGVGMVIFAARVRPSQTKDRRWRQKNNWWLLLQVGLIYFGT